MCKPRENITEILALVKLLCSELKNRVKSAFFLHFVDVTCDKNVVVVPTNVLPTDFNKFVIQIIFIRGSFDNEMSASHHSCIP